MFVSIDSELLLTLLKMFGFIILGYSPNTRQNIIFGSKQLTNDR